MKRVLLLLSAASIVVAAVPAAAQTTPNRHVTFSKDIAPILQRSCQNCHRPDSIAPMSLLTYEQARPYARAMKQRTALARSQYGRGAMPPWFIEKNIGVQTFKDDPSLSDEEIALFAAWADNGAPEGNPADLPPPRTFASAVEWTLGKPDLIVSSPEVSVKGVGPDWWGEPWGPQPIGNTEERYLSSVEYKEALRSGGAQRKAGSTLGGLYVFHHGSASITTDPANGPGEGDRTQLPSHELGRNPDLFPHDAGRLLKAHSYAAWNNIHIHPSGVPGDDKTVRLDLGLRLHPRGYKPRYVSQGLRSFGRTELEVNANAGNQRIEAYWVAQQPIRLVSYEPHLHAAGVRMCLEALYEWSIETLNCAGYDHNWVRTYNYDDNGAPLLPKGTLLRATAWFDNTAKNANIIEPRNQGNWGRRTVVNMFIVFNQAVFLTDQQYKEELAKRREYLDRTEGWDTLVGCPGCWNQPATPAATQ